MDDRREEAKKRAKLYANVQTIPEDIQKCLLEIVQVGLSPDQVRHWYCVVREHFGGSDGQSSDRPMDTHFELPAEPPVYSGPATPHAPSGGVSVRNTRSGPVSEPGFGPNPKASNLADKVYHQRTPAHESGPFISPVSATSRPDLGSEPAFVTPTSSAPLPPQASGSVGWGDSPPPGTFVEFTGGGLMGWGSSAVSAQPPAPPYGLGVSTSPGAPTSYVMAANNNAEMSLLPPPYQVSQASSAPPVFAETFPPIQQPAYIHSPPFDANAPGPRTKRPKTTQRAAGGQRQGPRRAPRRTTHPVPPTRQQPSQVFPPLSGQLLQHAAFPTSTPFPQAAYGTPTHSPQQTLQSYTSGPAATSDPSVQPRRASSQVLPQASPVPEPQYYPPNYE